MDFLEDLNYDLYSTVTSGLEIISKQELEEKINFISCQELISRGRVMIKCLEKKRRFEIIKEIINRIRSIEHLFLILFSFDSKIVIENNNKDSKNKQELKDIKIKEIESLFNQKIKEHKSQIEFLINEYRNFTNLLQQNLNFRINVKKNKSNKEEKNILAKDFSLIISENFPYLSADLKDYEILFIFEKIDKIYYLSIKITKSKSLGLSQISKDRLKTKATMRPSTAYSMLRLLDIKEGDFIIDPMSGSSMFAEIALKEFNKQAFYICSDIDNEAILKSQINLKNYQYVDLILCNAQKSPFRNNCFDKIITDMPFGKRCGNHSKNFKLYPALSREFNRIAIINKKNLFLTTEKMLISNNFKKKMGWRKDNYITINKGGLDAYIFVCYKLERKKNVKKIINLDFFYF